MLGMPRANRYILPGYAYHLTHRCHNRSFLLRFAKDRTEYRQRLREAAGACSASVLTYCITSNHVHVLLTAESPQVVSGLMQKLEGEFAQYYNIRKRRSGAFWGGRYGCTMIDGGRHLWNCMQYIELNMVRAGVVQHPRQWPWCGFQELSGKRQRYRLVDTERVLELCGGGKIADFVASYQQSIQAGIERQEFAREPRWTESIAVGGEAFVKAVGAQTTNRSELEVEETAAETWTLRETGLSYG